MAHSGLLGFDVHYERDWILLAHVRPSPDILGEYQLDRDRRSRQIKKTILDKCLVRARMLLRCGERANAAVDPVEGILDTA